jgi:aldose 1-epimerase
MSFSTEGFGLNKQNKEIHIYTIENSNGTSMKLTDMGASLVSFEIADTDNNKLDVVLGLKSGEFYELHNWDAMGATIGRNANRISGHSFELSGQRYVLADNARGSNIHSGPNMYFSRLWDVAHVKTPEGEGVCFSLFSPDGDQGMPGNLDINVTYVLTEDNELIITYDGICDKDTIINMTNHSYFNLNGHSSGNVDEHMLQINADRVMYSEDGNMSNQEIHDVSGTVYDFRKLTRLNTYNALYDNNFCLNDYNGDIRWVSALVSEQSGLRMDVYTDTCGLQVYNVGKLNNRFSPKGDAHYIPRNGIALETQFYPDAVNHPEYASPVVKAGDKYHSRTVYKFSIMNEVNHEG